MNAISGPASVGSHTFLDLVDFKWLMAGRGWWVDLSRLQRDVTYAGECLQRGLNSGSELLRQRSVELMPLCEAVDATASAPSSVGTSDAALQHACHQTIWSSSGRPGSLPDKRVNAASPECRDCAQSHG